jgi:ABC-type sugar transport system substrate-binding protein
VRRTVLALAVTALLGGVAAPSLAATADLPVGVTYSTKDGVFVGTTVFDQPAAGAAVYDGKACVGFSYQIPQCVEIGVAK